MEINIHLCSSGTIMAGNFANSLITEFYKVDFLLVHISTIVMSFGKNPF